MCSAVILSACTTDDGICKTNKMRQFIECSQDKFRSGYTPEAMRELLESSGFKKTKHYTSKQMIFIKDSNNISNSAVVAIVDVEDNKIVKLTFN
jgi:hypothetical protein